MDKNIARVGTNAVKTNGRAFNIRPPVVYEFRLPSQSGTVASGTTRQIIIQSASERSVLVDRVKALGGSCAPVILGIMFRVFQTVTIPACAGGTLQASAGVNERHALTTINFAAGKAGSAYLMGRTESFGLLMSHMEKNGLFSAQMRAMYDFCADTQVTAARVRQDTNGGGVFSSLDNKYNTVSRPWLEEGQLRRIYNGNTSITTPEDFTPACDLLYLPLTADGTYGLSDAGISFDDLFSADSQWILNITPRNNVDLYPTVASGGAAATFGDFTIEVSLLYRVHDGAQTEGEEPVPPTFGDVYQWNSNAGTIPVGTAQNIAGELVNDHAFVGFLPTLWTDTTDSGKFYGLRVDAGTTPDYIPKIRIVWPAMNAADLNTNGKYVRIGDGVQFAMPPGGTDQLARANEPLETWNARFRNASIRDGFDPYAHGEEFQTFGDAGVRTATTTLCSTGVVQYGVWPAGSVVTTLTPSSYDDVAKVVSLGGLAGYPLAWSDRSAGAGFAGVSPRAHDDVRAIQVTTIGGVSTPVLPQGAGTTPQAVQVWRYMGPYQSFSSGECRPCGNGKVAPLAINPSSPNAALGKAMTVSFVGTNVTAEAVGTPMAGAKNSK